MTEEGEIFTGEGGRDGNRICDMTGEGQGTSRE